MSQITKLDIYDGGRLRDFESYALYAAFAVSDRFAYIKVGMSVRVYERIVVLRCGCPFPIKVVLFDHVGDRKTVRKMERLAHEEFSDRRIAGEWFRFNMAEQGDKIEFHDGMARVFTRHLGRGPDWKKITEAQIRAYATVAKETQRKNSARRKREALDFGKPIR